MSADKTPTGTHGLLRGQRTRSYGSLVSSLSPIRQRRINHNVQPGETLQGLSLKYGVSMEQIKRANRLYTNDSIFLKESLFIPVLTESASFSNGVKLTEETSPTQTHTKTSDETHTSQTDSICHEENTDLSPVEYLKKIDSLISQSKQAAVKTCQEGEKQFSSMEQLHYGNLASSKASSQQAVHGAVPITITKRTRNLRHREDEIFQL
ncbi:lysM and putative peptidoglycan-binding domain-containing protein 1-like [Xyrauchen texanus]|uniref:lysM and putative peptidoglycan-binding domain-containing protein 1-like n=1 Tax=Xyrauchen texanus TaxID=154827 RepID=UPI002241FC0C|nr:lysM and putative peptidoglycan-binding domain-containing protein 1-like [Xyrauchen texanus]XP_052000768.1 lysM and putative peptidoglycan-binding domain-containing protein 1-like [Xyrauchen texanus]XP_052000769.1 lysM and putative peptidoglycan-binding domain-containing protein 1-like [Xyrauchen texanus]